MVTGTRSDMNAGTVVRTMLPDDIRQCMMLSSDEGWNQTETDWKMLSGHPGNICLVAESGNRIAGSATAMNYGNRIAWIGMVLVDKKFRGRGIAGQMLNMLLDRLGSCGSVKLDATPAGQPVYEKLGFKSEYNIYRMTAPAAGGFEPGKPETLTLPKEKAVRATGGELEAVAGLDAEMFGTGRMELIRSLFANDRAKAFVTGGKQTVTAFSLGRKGRIYHQLGPVGALSENGARAVIGETLRMLQGKAVVVDVPDYRESLAEWLERAGFTVQRHFVRMYLQKNPFPGRRETCYLICGPEFG